MINTAGRDIEQWVLEILAKRQRGEKLTDQEERVLAFTYYVPRTCRAAAYYLGSR